MIEEYTSEHPSLFSLNIKYGLPRLPSPPSDIETQQSFCPKRKPGAPDSSSFPCQSNRSPIERDGEIRMGADSVCERTCPHRRNMTVMRAETQVVLYVVWSNYIETEMELRHWYEILCNFIKCLLSCVLTEKRTERLLRERNIMLLVFIFINEYTAIWCFWTVHHSIELFHLPTLMHNSLFINNMYVTLLCSTCFKH